MLFRSDNYALCAAVVRGDVNIVKMLLNVGADVNVRDNYAICYAARNGNWRMLEVLLEAWKNKE